MHLMYFTEQPMSAYPEQEGRDFGATALMFSNKNFDPVAGSRLYNDYLEHYRLAEDVGFDGIMLNEHHNAIQVPLLELGRGGLGAEEPVEGTLIGEAEPHVVDVGHQRLVGDGVTLGLDPHRAHQHQPAERI